MPHRHMQAPTNAAVWGAAHAFTFSDEFSLHRPGSWPELRLLGDHAAWDEKESRALMSGQHGGYHSGSFGGDRANGFVELSTQS